MATFQSLPVELHIMIAKLLNLKESLIYSQLCRVTFDAVYYVFSHRKQLDFSSVWGPNNTIALSDSMILKVMHAHTRVEVITGFSVSESFSSYADLKNFMEHYWVLSEGEEFGERGHETGQLMHITFPQGTHSGGVTREQGCALDAIWSSYSDSYGVFGIQQDYSLDPDFPPLNNAPSNWSSVDLDAPYSRDIPFIRWESERVWEIKCELSQQYFKKFGEVPTNDQIAMMS